ncbi:group I truncated hemoglobin [Roseateles cellulosilyticus]|uniref:Group 1 truncated hemoglobin n=1 Tax=Pelomonas cellulosilytica TaxID=2906762 RepID=A0ABS8XV59_9BURK|nr:group 1 truncated hemoglobin [Pelomonas sp. P8]MCE4554511.1 group 1 truncated hemoglobin [Pelomonas sp. P8]
MRPTAIAAPLLAYCTACAQTPPTDDSLYRAWGGEAGIRAVMEDFVPRLFTDPRTARFFERVDRNNLVARLTEQLCKEAGGPCAYTGAAMKPVHADLGIGKRDFNALVEILQQAMDARGIPFPAQNRMLARLAPMHRQIITPVSDSQQHP